MRVLHLIGGGDVGGAKIHVLSLVRELGKKINVKLISFRPGAFADDARSMGIDVEVVRSGNIFSDIKRVLQIIREGKYEILHSHGAKANVIALIAKNITGLPVVTTVHSDYRLDYLHSLPKMVSFGLLNTVALRFLDYYIGVSESTSDMLIRRKFNPNRVFTVRNGIDFENTMPEYSRENFSAKYNIDLGKDDIVVGILCRLDPVKGLNVFLQAAKEVLKQVPSVKFIIGGEGQERKSLERKAASLGISDKVHFIGWVNDMYEFMSCIDINVLTSLSEGFPYVILEGARMKKATVSSDVGGISDLIVNGENGFLFAPGDYNKLAEHIITLVKDNRLRQEMGEKIYGKAREYFSLNNMFQSQISIYNTVLKEKAAYEKGVEYDVIISGYYGFMNIGDEALLHAIIKDLRSFKSDINIMVFSKNVMETMKTHGVYSINRINLVKMLHAMKRAKLFIYGGGNIIQDNTSTRSLLYYLGTIWMAKRMGLKVMFYANGISPLRNSISKMLTRRIVNRVDVITLREELSKHELERLCINQPRVQITSDPTLTLEAADDSEVDAILKNEGIDGPGPFIGFSIRKWPGYEKYIKIIAQAADYVINLYGAKPVFIPMQYPADLNIANMIVSKMKGKGYIIKTKNSVSQTIGVIKKMDMLVGMRLHSLIFAACVNTPVVGLAYESKVEGFLQYINQNKASAGHIEQLEFNSLKEVMDYVWNNRDEIRIQLEKEVAVLKKKALDSAQIAVELIEDDQNIESAAK